MIPKIIKCWSLRILWLNFMNMCMLYLMNIIGNVMRWLMWYYEMLNCGHDSYWTHACDVDEMNRILREKFVELYDAPILENVKYFVSLIYTGFLIGLNVPCKLVTWTYLRTRLPRMKHFLQINPFWLYPFPFIL